MVLTVVLADTYRTYVAITHENESVPYRRRTVQIELTPEQVAQLQPRKTGNHHGTDQFEEVIAFWIEPNVPGASL